jgi:tubulin---tyrosine ligase
MPPNYVNSYLVPKFKEQIIMSLESVKRKLKVGKGFFELFGYDFILDGEYNPWLIEVNTNPCLEESSKLLEKYVPRMVNDMLKLTVDLAFPPKRGQAPYNIRELNKFSVPGYSND